MYRNEHEIEFADLHVHNRRFSTSRVIKIGPVNKPRISGLYALLEKHADIQIAVLRQDDTIANATLIREPLLYCI